MTSRSTDEPHYPRLVLPIARATAFILVHPHYPENVGAAARAIKTMGMLDLRLVKPGRLAIPTHEMAQKMAVKAWDVLDGASVHPTLDDALAGVDVVFATTSRRGVSGVISPRAACTKASSLAGEGRSLAVVFGNEKSGLTSAELERSDERIRIPIAADQPSINLAQAVQIIAYEWFVEGLAVRG